MTGARRDLVDRVASVVREVSAEMIEPRFDALTDDQVRAKAPGELVTVADEEAEVALSAQLAELLPGVPVVGEEACSADPSLLAALDGRRAWLVDPLDGTANFVAGSPNWAVMVALVEHGSTVAGWIWCPRAERMYVAERGSGATCNDMELQRAPVAGVRSELRGAVLRRFLPADTAQAVVHHSSGFAQVTDGTRCAGIDHPAVLQGDLDFVLFWRTLPWDHAAGVLIAEEAGLIARRLDRRPYRPRDPGTGLLIAAGHAAWDAAATILQ